MRRTGVRGRAARAAAVLASLLLAGTVLSGSLPGSLPGAEAEDQVASLAVPRGGVPPGCAAARAHEGPWRVVFVGDSMTQGLTGSATYRYWAWRGLQRAGVDARFVGPRRETNRIPAGVRPAQSYEHLGHGFARQLAHAGRSRTTFVRHPDPPADLARRFSPDLVVLQLGYNDVNEAGVDAEEVARRTQAFLDAVWAVDDELGRPRTRFVLGQVPEAGRSPKIPLAEKNATTRRANVLIRKRLVERCLVEVNDLRDSRSPAWSPAVHTYDGTHPNPVGETLMAQRMLDAMRRLGVYDEPVDVVRPRETWAPHPQVGARALGGDRWRLDLAGERARLGADRMRLRVTTPDGRVRTTDWMGVAVDRVTRRLLPGARVQLEAERGRRPGLPTVSEPGPAFRVPARAPGRG